MTKTAKKSHTPSEEPRVPRPGAVRNLREVHIAALEAKTDRSTHEEWVLKTLKEKVAK